MKTPKNTERIWNRENRLPTVEELVEEYTPTELAELLIFNGEIARKCNENHRTLGKTK